MNKVTSQPNSFVRVSNAKSNGRPRFTSKDEVADEMVILFISSTIGCKSGKEDMRDDSKVTGQLPCSSCVHIFRLKLMQE